MPKINNNRFQEMPFGVEPPFSASAFMNPAFGPVGPMAPVGPEMGMAKGHEKQPEMGMGMIGKGGCCRPQCPTTCQTCPPIHTCSQEVVDQYHITRQPYIHTHDTHVCHHYIHENIYIPQYTCSESCVQECGCGPMLGCPCVPGGPVGPATFGPVGAGPVGPGR